MNNCSDCGGCTSCGSCGGCGRSLALTEPELRLLRLFSQLPFLPAARKASDEVPVFLEEGDPAENSAALACLEKKGLIDIDYHLPLSGFNYSAYTAYPLHGSMALTARGQEVLDTIDLQGIEEE
jgi:hypothetical protein